MDSGNSVPNPSRHFRDWIAVQANAGDTVAEPLEEVWRLHATYDEDFHHLLVQPLLRAAAAHNGVPFHLQLAALRRICWYFIVDARTRAPTAWAHEPLSCRFHEHLHKAMACIEPRALHVLAQEQPGLPAEVVHALSTYHSAGHASAPLVAQYDRDQKLACIRYFLHGTRSRESWHANGRPAQPVYAKYRACKFLGRVLLCERIAWLRAEDGDRISLQLNGTTTHLPVGPSSEPPQRQSAAPAGAGLWGHFRQLKSYAVKTLARLPWVRTRYRDAWVLIDRQHAAGDNAEHLYRWITRQHPELNAWFLLSRQSPDWHHLQQEGFRLMPEGLSRKLLLLNCAHLISSHVDHVHGGFALDLYGDAIRWRFSFLQHGVTKSDIANLLRALVIDRLITSSPAEHASFVADDTAYPLTDREVRQTGFPRHDRLLSYARQVAPGHQRTLLVMPTWRANLLSSRAAGVSRARHRELIAASEYALRWRSFLRNPRLAHLCSRHGLHLAFLPHPLARPYVSVFDLPDHVQLLPDNNALNQQTFASTMAFVTDYTSVTFDMALLRCPSFYYVFDRDRYFGGEHTLRQGYFDEEKDGFGPVADDESALVDHLTAYIEGGCRTPKLYLDRMHQAMPLVDEMACQRTYESIRTLRGP